MLYRRLNPDRLYITQPNHAWVAGQLAHAWGNADFGAVTPRAAVCLAAAQHDIAWTLWETAPTWNPHTGYPHCFTEVGVPAHLALWRSAKALAAPLGRYVALLVSLHGTGLYTRFTHWQESAEARPLVSAFLQEEQAWQQQLITSLSADPLYTAHVTPNALARNQALIATWDALSLAICMGLPEEFQTIAQVPTAAGLTELRLHPGDHTATTIAIDPWCFHRDRVTVDFEGRTLTHPAANADEMHSQLAQAPWRSLEITLIPRSLEVS